MSQQDPQQGANVQGAGQAVAIATPATLPQIQPPQPAPQEIPAPQRHDASDPTRLKAAYDEVLLKKGKIKKLKSANVELTSALETAAKERDQFKANAATFEERLNALNAKRSDDLLVSELRVAGLDEPAARLLVPSLRGHVTVDPKTYDVTINKEEIARAVAVIKPPQPPATTQAHRLHSINAAARTEQPAPQVTSWKDRLKAEAQTLPK